MRAPKTAELIASYIRGQVVRGDLKTGDSLPSETVLMEMFGVSRPTLREAFRILEAESLISVRRGARGGARVVSPDIAVAARYVGLLLQMSGTTIADVYEARMATEPAAAGLLAARRTQQDLDDLNACVEHLIGLVESDEHFRDADAWSQATQRFHDLILERAGNRTLAVQVGVLREVVAMHLSTVVMRTFDHPDTQDQFRKLVRSYRKLVLLIDAGDAEGAERHWRTHMEVVGRKLLPGDTGAKTVVDLFGWNAMKPRIQCAWAQRVVATVPVDDPSVFNAYAAGPARGAVRWAGAGPWAWPLAACRPGAAEVSGVQAGPQGRRRRRCASSLEAGGAAPDTARRPFREMSGGVSRHR